jgi:hypothetical protein
MNEISASIMQILGMKSFQLLSPARLISGYNEWVRRTKVNMGYQQLSFALLGVNDHASHHQVRVSPLDGGF